MEDADVHNSSVLSFGEDAICVDEEKRLFDLFNNY